MITLIWGVVVEARVGMRADVAPMGVGLVVVGRARQQLGVGVRVYVHNM